MNILLPLCLLAAILIGLGVSAAIRGVREWRRHREFLAQLAARKCPVCRQLYGEGGRAHRAAAGLETEPQKWQVTCPHCHREALIVEGAEEEVRSESAA